MTFDEFFERCEFEEYENEDGRVSIIGYFTEGFVSDLSSEFVKKHRMVANKQIAKTMYDYLKEQFSNG